MYALNGSALSFIKKKNTTEHQGTDKPQHNNSE
jgi:hypothetical protein